MVVQNRTEDERKFKIITNAIIQQQLKKDKGYCFKDNTKINAPSMSKSVLESDIVVQT